jgi:hypothetical protein
VFLAKVNQKRTFLETRFGFITKWISKMRLENKVISMSFINTKPVERFILWLINNLKLFLVLPNVFLLSIKRIQMMCCEKNVSGKKQTVTQRRFSKKE